MEVLQPGFHGQKEDRVQTVHFLLYAIEAVLQHLHFDLLGDIRS